MTLPVLLANHEHITERETDGTWEDCTWCAGLEFLRLAYKASLPATHTEAEALRKASGDSMTGGSNIDDFRRGVTARYHISLPAAIKGFAVLWSALKPGTVALVQGSMVAFGPTDSLSRFDPKFDGGHAVLVARLDSQDRVWWCDPEAPEGTYEGQWITKAQLQKFVSAFAGKHIVAPIKVAAPTAPTGGDMPTLTKYTPGYVAAVKATANIRTAPVLTAATIARVSKGENIVIVGHCTGAADSGSTDWLVFFENGVARYTHSSNATSIKAPVAGPTYPDVRPQLAAAEATVTTQAATIASLKTDLTTAAADERDRIAIAEANRIRGI